MQLNIGLLLAYDSGGRKVVVRQEEALADFGVEFAVRQSRDLLKAGVPGLHIYTMDRSGSSVKIVERLRKEALL